MSEKDQVKLLESFSLHSLHQKRVFFPIFQNHYNFSTVKKKKKNGLMFCTFHSVEDDAENKSFHCGSYIYQKNEAMAFHFKTKRGTYRKKGSTLRGYRGVSSNPGFPLPSQVSLVSHLTSEPTSQDYYKAVCVCVCVAQKYQPVLSTHLVVVNYYFREFCGWHILMIWLKK